MGSDIYIIIYIIYNIIEYNIIYIYRFNTVEM